MSRKQNALSLTRAFEPLAAALHKELKLPFFFLALNPSHWRIDYYGLMSGADKPLVYDYNALVEKLKKTRKGESSGDYVDRVAEEFQKDLLKRLNLTDSLQQIKNDETSDSYGACVAEKFKNNFLAELTDDQLQALKSCVDGNQVRTAVSQIVAEQLRAVAFRILARQSIELGSRNFAQAANAPPQHPWFLRSNPTGNLKWFQKALHLAASGSEKKAHSLFESVYKTDLGADLLDLVRWPVIGVKKYMSSANLVDSRNIQFFLSEYLYAISQVDGKLLENWPKPSLFNHYFLPLEGLGQWRAAACWLLREDGNIQDGIKISDALHASLRIICSLALVDAFITDLSEILSSVGSGIESAEARIKIGKVFATLWFSREISFYRGDQFVFEFYRDDVGEMIPGQEDGKAGHLPCIPSDRFMLITYQPESNDHLIQLDLTHLPYPEPKNTAAILGFEKIVFSVPLFTSSEGEQSHAVFPFEEHLRERLAALLDLHHKRGAANRTDVVEAINHQMKRALESVAFPEAFNELRSMDQTSRDFPHVTAKCLTLCQLSQAVPSLFRLVTINQERQVEKMTGWFDKEKLKNWRTGGNEIVDHYVEVTNKFFAAMCWGNKMFDGFHLRVRYRDSSVRDLIVPTNDITFEPIIRWITGTKRGALPPLSLAKSDASSHIALFGILFEPLNNAINAANSFPAGSDRGKLYIEFTDRFHQDEKGHEERAGIIVSIGNECVSSPIIIPPRIVQLKRFLPFTQMAVVLEKDDQVPCDMDFDSDRGRNRFWVSVMLHPQKLASQVLSYMEDV